MFGPDAEAKLKADPRTKAFFNDVDFKNKFEMCKMDANFMMQVMQQDPRFMMVFSVVTGLDIQAMAEKHQEAKEDEERERRNAEEKRRKSEAVAEEERKKKQEEERYANLSPEEREEEDRKKNAEAKKAEGNKLYKA